MNLTFDNHGVDYIAAVIHSHKAANLHLPRSAVDVHYADVTTEWKRHIWRIVVGNSFQSRLHSLGMVGVGGKGDILDSGCFLRYTFHREFPGLPFQVIFTHLQEMGGDFLGLVPDFPTSHRSGCPCHRCRTAGVGAKTVRGRISIAFFNGDIRHRNAKFFCNDLCIGGFMPLAL